jgi:hypothetical protein
LVGQDIVEGIILKHVSKKWGVQIPIVGYCEHSKEYLGFIKGGKFLDPLNDSRLCKKDPRIMDIITAFVMTMIIQLL